MKWRAFTYLLGMDCHLADLVRILWQRDAGGQIPIDMLRAGEVAGHQSVEQGILR